MLEKLLKILPVPESPIDTAESCLKKITKSLKVQFPTDFLEFGRVYGSGTISVESYSWEIYSPFREKFPDYVKQFFKRQDAYRQAADSIWGQR